MDWWDACVDPEARPVLSDPKMPVYLGLDGSVKHDQTAIVGCTFDKEAKKVQMVFHRIFRPSPKNPLDFEATIEQSLLDLRGHFKIRRVLFDPFQLVSVSQRLTRAHLPMEEYPQTSNRLEEMGSNLYELIKHRNLVTYPDSDVRLAVSRAVAVETPRGWKITKQKTSHKIDVVVALAMAALGAVEDQARPIRSGIIFGDDDGKPTHDINGRPFVPFISQSFVGTSAMPDRVVDNTDSDDEEEAAEPKFTPGATTKSPYA
jgi:phage terminase large subunit-like protein